MTAVAAPSALAEVEARITWLVESAGAHAADSYPVHAHPVHDDVRHAVLGGKYLRPTLLIAAAGTDAPRDAMIRAAAALELMHAALLAHDDIIDGDTERRGAPSIAAATAVAARRAGASRPQAVRAGLAAALVAGDVLLVRGMAELGGLEVGPAVRARALAIMERAMVRAAEGEHDDVSFAGRQPTEAQIELLLERKTADYSFRAPLELGAVLAGRAEQVVEALGDIGLRMGVLYQLRDDVLGIFGDEAVTGKSTISDVRAGAPTLLATLASRDPAWRRVAGDYGDPRADEGAASRIRHVMRASGALGAVEHRIRTGSDALRASIARLPVEHALRDDLFAMLDRCVERAR